MTRKRVSRPDSALGRSLKSRWRSSTRASRTAARERHTINDDSVNETASVIDALAIISDSLSSKIETKRKARRQRRSVDASRSLVDKLPKDPATSPADIKSKSLHAVLFDTYVNNALSNYQDHRKLEYKENNERVQCLTDIQLIAYYLPQFHPIPENDKWWGDGFTEWRNVSRAFPQFPGHYQPRMPSDLGYYDLRIIDTMRRQVQIAKNYGISAFCFHFYWFAGKTLLELPIRNFLNNNDIQLDFCLCWANENWSRRWDGSDDQVLISQDHSPDDDIAFIRYVAQYFRDSRYLRIDGRPVLTVYRPSQLPDCGATIARWREEVEKMGFPGIYLIATNAFGFTDYETFGFDALSEFPPHQVESPNIQDKIEVSEYRSGSRIRSYEDVVASETARARLPYGIIHPGVMPSWDNSARRPFNGEIIHGSTPSLFGSWLADAVARASNNPPRQRLVFINGWNEWAEGAYLEPDSRYGYAYLSECYRVLSLHAKECTHARLVGEQARTPHRRTILMFAHWLGSQVYGGEKSLLDVVSCLSAAGYNLIVALPNASNSEYISHLRRHVAEVIIFPYSQWTVGYIASVSEVEQLIDVLLEQSPDLVYVNTIVVPGPLLAARLMNIPIVVHAREIINHDPDLLSQTGETAESVVQRLRRSADWIIANSEATSQSLGVDERVFVVPNGVESDSVGDSNQVKEYVRFGLVSSNLPKKGIEDFVKLAELCLTAEPRARFIVIGPLERVPEILRHAGLSSSLPPNLELRDYLGTKQALDLLNVVVNFSHFQESFGRTLLEGMVAMRPSIAYRWGALSELVLDGVTGFLIPYQNPEAAIAAVKYFCEDHRRVAAMGEAARERAVSQFSMKKLTSGLDNIIKRALMTTLNKQPSYAEVRADRITAQLSRSIDVVVCVHNAIDDACKCLTSVQEHTARDRRIIIVDDGSDAETASYLEQFAISRRRVELIRHNEALGYTRAANAGLRASTGDLVIFLNSDTVVAPNWAEKMADAVFSTRGAGIVGPLSNAASYQSIPSTVDTGLQTAVNALPASLSIDQINAFCEDWTMGHNMPYAPLVHGFCFGITRMAINTVGEFDERAFPFGYGEENDYCLRALRRGVWPVIATHTFVYHAKTKSYSESRRSELAASAQEVLYERYSRQTFLTYVRLLKNSPQLVAIREKASLLWQKSIDGVGLPTEPSPRNPASLEDETLFKRSVQAETLDGIR